MQFKDLLIVMILFYNIEATSQFYKTVDRISPHRVRIKNIPQILLLIASLEICKVGDFFFLKNNSHLKNYL